MSRHVEGCEPMGAHSCAGCAENAQAWVDARELRKALRRALRQIDRLADAVEDEAGLYDSGEASGMHPHATHLWRKAKTARAVAARLNSLLKRRK